MNVSDANEIRFFIGAAPVGCTPSLPRTPLQSPWHPALPQTRQPRFIRQGARSTPAATTARIARTYLRARVSAISDIRPDAVRHPPGCRGPYPRLPERFFAFKPLDRFIRVRRACRLARRDMPQACLRVLIKE